MDFIKWFALQTIALIKGCAGIPIAFLSVAYLALLLIMPAKDWFILLLLLLATYSYVQYKRYENKQRQKKKEVQNIKAIAYLMFDVFKRHAKHLHVMPPNEMRDILPTGNPIIQKGNNAFIEFSIFYEGDTLEDKTRALYQGVLQMEITNILQSGYKGITIPAFYSEGVPSVVVDDLFVRDMLLVVHLLIVNTPAAYQRATRRPKKRHALKAPSDDDF